MVLSKVNSAIDNTSSFLKKLRKKKPVMTTPRKVLISQIGSKKPVDEIQIIKLLGNDT